MNNLVELPVQGEDYKKLAIEKIEKELKEFKGNNYGSAVKDFVASTLTNFCRQNERFAEVLYKTKRTLSDCCEKIMRGCGRHISDIDVYRAAVKYYFPNSEIEFQMNIKLTGEAPSKVEMEKVEEKPAPKKSPKKETPKAEAKKQSNGVKMSAENKKSDSGGGDPLHEYNQHRDWYRRLFEIVKGFHVEIDGKKRSIPVEMHTSYMTDESDFPFFDCYRVVYHANSIDQLSHIRRTRSEKTRVVFVVTADFTVEDIMNIALYVKNSRDIDELSFRQLVNNKYEEEHYLEDYLRMGHKKLWWYIEQCDYNLYYAENRVFMRYKDFQNINEA